MKGSTIFIAGVYGTGKSTMCTALSERLHIPAFSAGDLISMMNGEQYGANKAVANKDDNQVLLAGRVNELNRKNKTIILAGHFCIFNTDNHVEVLPDTVYSALNIMRIILLESDVHTIIAHLPCRDARDYQYADPAEAMTLKLDAYQELKTQAPMAERVAAFASTTDKNENDRIDTALLNEVYQGRVDLLITEDKRLRRKAVVLGLGNKVLSINAFLTIVTNENPDLIEYKALAVQKVTIGTLDVRNEFFDSLRNAYSGFDAWFSRKCDEDAYICRDDTDNLLGFLYLKKENEDENYSDILPRFEPKKRLKIGTFKVDATGFRLGERFIKIILDNAIKQNVDEVYVTLFEDRPELETLATLLSRWGFENYGTKASTGEVILTKQMRQYLPELSPRQNFPNLIYGVQKFILPILPQYHTSLLPDSILRNENENNFLEKTPYRYALQKVYSPNAGVDRSAAKQIDRD